MKLKIGITEYDINYENELKCDEVTINEDLKNQPSLFAFYAVFAEIAESEVAILKLETEKTEAILDDEYRGKLEKSTENMLKNAVRRDERYLSLMYQLNTAKKNAGILNAIKEAFHHRKEILIALASNMRAQMDPDIYIKKQEIKATL